MVSESSVVVHGTDGLRGSLERIDEPGPSDPGRFVVRFDRDLLLALPAELVVKRRDGGYDVPIGRAELDRLRRGEGLDRGEALVVPVVAEELDVHKRTVETGRVRITKTVTEREELIDEPLLREEVQVERVAVGRRVDGPVAVRQEGETTIIPVVREVLVVEKRLMLVEELHVTRRRSEHRDPQRVTLRAEEAVVERLAPEPSPEDL